MLRLARMLGLGGAVALATAVVIACNNDDAQSCTVDTDCPNSYICRDNGCTPTEQGTNAATDSGPGTACANDNASCTVDTDCCAGTCTNNVCTATVSQPTCTGLSALCQGPDDCCTGLSCVKGVCQ